MAEGPTLEKSFKFALRIVKLYQHLVDVHKEFVLSKFLLASGTQIGARVESAQQAEDRFGFIREMGIALQKASETKYWLKLLQAGEYLNQAEFDSMATDNDELVALLTSIVKTSKGLK